MKIKDFCMKHDACRLGYERAKHYNDMDDFLQNSTHYNDVIWACTRIMTKKERVQFSCWCVRQVWDLLTDERSKNAIIIGEKYAQGFVSDDELNVAAAAAAAAATYAAYAAADADAAYAAYTAAAYTAAAAAAAAYTAAAAAAAAAAADAVAVAAAVADSAIIIRKKQVEYLKDNFVFNWER